MLVSDLPMKRSSVTHIEKTEDGGLESNTIAESTYGRSAEKEDFKVTAPYHPTEDERTRC